MKIFFSFITLLLVSISHAQNEKPQLVVGLVIDQMRYDYLYRFENKYSEDGFKRLLREGFHVENTHYNYVPTYTAVGHASIYTGTTPQNHGIISNNWYDKTLKQEIYCVDDSKYHTVGLETNVGQKSPYRMKTTTLTDQLHLAQNLQGKTISIAIKDRSAILPGGHTANAAYWFEGGNSGKWITSSFYMGELPQWVQLYNAKNIPEVYANEIWDTYYSIETYTESMTDNNPYEGLFKGESSPTFPRDLKKLRYSNGNYNILKSTPFGNTLTTDFAETAIAAEKLGQTTGQTDFLAISYSSTDYVGHKYGVDSKEIEDTYIRMDLEIARLLKYLDKTIGKNKYTLFLTADHAVAQTPSYMNALNIPGGYFDSKAFEEFVMEISKAHFKSTKIIENISNYQLFFNKKELRKLKLKTADVETVFAEALLDFDAVYKTITATTLQTSEFTQGIYSLLQQGYNQKISGNVMYVPYPSVISGHADGKGTTHGSGYSYDTHVPLIFFGNGIEQGNSKNYTPITNIAPTIANLLHIEIPNGATGTIIEGVLQQD